MAWYMVWPYRHSIGHVIVLWCSLVGMAWYMVMVSGPGMVYGMFLRALHGIWYCLARYGIAYGAAWQDHMYMVWPGGYMIWSIGHVMIYGVV